MAGISFLDLMLAEALAAGVARERAAAERPPENFFNIPRDPQAWRNIQTACKKEHMVIGVEITDNMNENCRRNQAIFLQLARKYDNLPFFRATISLGCTFDEVSRGSYAIYTRGRGRLVSPSVGVDIVFVWEQNPSKILVCLNTI